MRQKEKPCKGTGKALGHGCGNMQLYRKYGLGTVCRCLQKWLSDSPEGIAEVSKLAIKTKAATKKVQRAKDREQRKALRKKSEWEEDLQKIINAIVRAIDAGVPCISSYRPMTTNINAGHFWSVGSNPAVRFNLLNIYAQSVEQNQHKGGNPLGFIDGLTAVYGIDHYERVHGLKAAYPLLKLSIPELQEAIDRARECLKDLTSKNMQYPDPDHRIELRDHYNKIIAIYA